MTASGTRIALGLALAAAAAAGAWLYLRPAPRPNVLLVTLDTTRADRLGPYGYAAANTPTIDALASQGWVFEEALSSAPITMPAHSTIMTGLLPPAHGVRDNGAYSLPEEAVTLAERLHGEGYATQAFVSAVVLSKRYNLVQGFDRYDDDLWNEDDPKLFMIRERQASDTIDAALEWFDAWRGQPQRQPFFTWIHLFDPHQPYRAPSALLATSPSPYDAEIAYADHQLGRLVDALRAAGTLDDTLIVVTADHGESLGEHEEKTHAVFVYRATTHVPLIVRYPARFPAGRRIAAPVHHVDIVPTLLAALELPPDVALPGLDMADAGSIGDRPLYSESLLAEVGFGMAPLHAVRESGHTFIRAPRPELYDLTVDPGETRNLIGDPGKQTLADGLDISLQQVMDAAAATALSTPRNPLSEESIEMLQSLGYLQSASERQGVAGMDPKDGIRIYNQLEAARRFAQNGDWDASADAARAILAEIPGHASARGVLATALLNSGKIAEARDEYLRIIAQNPSEFRVHAMLGAIALRDGELDTAERHYRDALSAAPTFIEAMSGMGLIAMMRGDDAAARTWFDQVVAIDAGFPDVHRLLGDLYFEQEQFGAARDAYALSLRLKPDDYRTLIQAAASARRADDAAQARAWLLTAIERQPQRWIAYYNLACLEAIGGNADAAFEHLQDSIEREPETYGFAKADPDWAALRADPRFAALVRLTGKVLPTD